MSDVEGLPVMIYFRKLNETHSELVLVDGTNNLVRAEIKISHRNLARLVTSSSLPAKGVANLFTEHQGEHLETSTLGLSAELADAEEQRAKMIAEGWKEMPGYGSPSNFGATANVYYTGFTRWVKSTPDYLASMREKLKELLS